MAVYFFEEILIQYVHKMSTTYNNTRQPEKLQNREVKLIRNTICEFVFAFEIEKLSTIKTDKSDFFSLQSRNTKSKKRYNKTV